jgi:hypothetical protein
MSCFWLEPKQRSLEVLQAHFPLGMAWDAFRTAGKNAYALLSALAESFEDAWESLCFLVSELDPRTTDQLIVEWETAVSLPDRCLPTYSTLQERRDWVMWRLNKKRWNTAQDWKDLALLFGFEIDITPGWLVQKRALFWDDTSGHFPTFPLAFDNFPKLGRFRVYIDVIGASFHGFQYGENDNPGFPIPFEDGPIAFQDFKCLIDRVRPANVVIIWNDNPLRNGCYSELFEDVFSEELC